LEIQYQYRTFLQIVDVVVNTGGASIDNINSYITSGNVNAVINSGNINALISSGNIRVLSGNITLLNSGVNVGPTNPLPVTIASGSIGGNGLPVSLDPSLVDAFNRIRVSNPFTVFDSQQRYQQSNKWNYLGGWCLFGSLATFEKINKEISIKISDTVNETMQKYGIDLQVMQLEKEIQDLEQRIMKTTKTSIYHNNHQK
jgi:hypothetical protein